MVTLVPRRVAMPKTMVRAASPTGIEQRLVVVAERMRRWNTWLNHRHPYSGNVLKRLGNSGTIDGPKLGEYIACSAPLHLADGWNYLSRAFDAACRGDPNSAYHLAYYSELRAAISLLATEGIGVFNRRHIALNERLEPTELKKRRMPGTHVATWQLLSAWAREPGRAERLLESITVESKSLSAWLEAVGVVRPSRQLVARRWLGAWSVDLRILSADPRRRNAMSYRPSRIEQRMSAFGKTTLPLTDPVFHSWAELEPEIGRASAALDLSLLRQAIKLSVDEGICNYSSLHEALEALEDDLGYYTYEALCNGSTSAESIFRDAEISRSRDNSPTPILARSVLLLRLASARTASLLDSSGISKADLEFWWIKLGSDLGFWDDASDIENFSDLWTDVNDAMTLTTP